MSQKTKRDLNESLIWALKKSNKTIKKVDTVEEIEDMQRISNLCKMEVHGEEKNKVTEWNEYLKI